MGKETLTFVGTEIEKTKCYHYKCPVPLRDVTIEKVLVSNNVSFSKKTISALLATCVIIIKLAITYNVY